jgi:hypothetical protein
MDNLILADKLARRGKAKQRGVIDHDQNREANLFALQQMLVHKTYRTSAYFTFKLFDPKEREISKLPYFPDRILHHAVMNKLEGMFTAMFTADTYSCIKGKGVHAAKSAIELALKDLPGTKYCLKLDIRKFYPSIDHDILKAMLRRKLKDKDLLWLLDEIIDSAPGVPIGNYLSQYLANFYLCYFDHWLKEIKGVKYYFRYADDMVILSGSKEYLHRLRAEIETYLALSLRLDLKDNWQVFPVDARGIDCFGYVHFHGYTLLRKRNKQKLAISVKRGDRRQVIAARRGWAIHCNSKNLLRKLIPNHEQLLRLPDQGSGKKLCRGQDQDRKSPEHQNNRSRFPDRERELQRRAARPADRI